MIFPKTKEIGLKLNWHQTKNSIFGTYKGYLFSIRDSGILDNPQFKHVISITEPLDSDKKQAIIDELKRNKKSMGLTQFEVGADFVVIRFMKFLLLPKSSVMLSALDFIVEIFQRLGLKKTDVCSNCGSIDNLDHYDLNDSGVLLCKNCFLKTESRFEELTLAEESTDKNYLRGFLGSLVFSVPGIICWALISVYLHIIASGMSVAIAFLGIKGYEYVKAREGKFKKYSIVASNVISIIIANYLSAAYLLYLDGANMKLIFHEFSSNYDLNKYVLGNIILSFVLAFFVWVWLLNILWDSKRKIVLAQTIK